MPHAVGAAIPRVDARDKVTGLARYVGDLVIPGMVHGKVLRSPHPSARIVGIDTSRAEALPGVVGVLSGQHLLDIDPYYGHAIKDRPILAIDRVRFVGEPIVAVAAVDEATAKEALTVIDVTYEPLRAATMLVEALAPDAPRLHEGPLRSGLFHGLGELRQGEGNICYHHSFRRGDLQAAFASAAVIVEGEYTFPAVYQYAMEPHTVVAAYEPDGITLWATCQHPHLVRAEIADLFKVPLAHVRVIVPYIGGGFGSKSYTKMEPITVALARKVGKPVRLANTVGEAMVTTRRHNMRCWMRTAADRDGRLTGRECRLWLDTGAYADNGPRVAATAADAAPGPYRWPSMAVDAWAIYTNTAPAGSYRAFGAAHLGWIGELQIDQIARRLGRDPVQFRQHNLLHPGEEVRPGGKPLDADLIGDVTQVAAKIGWGTPNAPSIGRGVSVGLLAAGANPVSTASVRMDATGNVDLLGSTTELGQGSRTVFTQIVAEELRLPPDRITVVSPDTRSTPYDRSTGASRSTTVAGKAVQMAAADLREQLVGIAGRVWNLPKNALEVRAGAVWHETESLSYADLIKRHFGMVGGELLGWGEVRPEHGTGTYREGPVFWEVCVAAAEVQLDPETGQVRVGKVATVADVGKAINPVLVEAQDEGAALQGLGNALFEEMVFQDGQLINDSLVDYRVPTSEDMPGELHSILIEHGDGPGPYGAKGVGEGGLAAVLAAIVLALSDAGVDVRELPMTSERTWRVLRDLESTRTRFLQGVAGVRDVPE